MPGPPPKRPGERLGHPMGARDSRNGFEKAASGTGADVQPPEANPNWHPYAIGWFNSLKLSGQSQFYEPSDWMTAVIAAEALDDYLQWSRRATVLAEFNAFSIRLMCAEGDRRRMRLELEKGAADLDEENSKSNVVRMRKKLA